MRDWQKEERKQVREAKLVGHRWSAPSAALRDFLARNQVPYRWYAADTIEDGGYTTRQAPTTGTCRC